MSRSLIIAALGFIAATTAIGLAYSLREAEVSGSVRDASVVSAEYVALQPGQIKVDVVRLGARGDAVLAGRAAPKAEIVISADGAEWGRTQADLRGEWVFVPPHAPEPGAILMDVQIFAAEGQLPAQEHPLLWVVLDGRGSIAFRIDPQRGLSRLSHDEDGGVGVVIELIDMPVRGASWIRGRAPVGRQVQVSGDGRPLGQAIADNQGNWEVQAPLAAVRILRADLVDGKGRTGARAEVPMEMVPVLPPRAGVVLEQGKGVLFLARALPGQDPVTTVYYGQVSR